MCLGCWLELGSPKVFNKAVREAHPLIDLVYASSPVGGNLHIQLDDWNIDDEFFAGEMVVYHTDSDLAAERRCYEHFKSMTVEERASALALYEGFYEPSA